LEGERNEGRKENPGGLDGPQPKLAVAVGAPGVNAGVLVDGQGMVFTNTDPGHDTWDRVDLINFVGISFFCSHS
jgi:hypothetical protein